MSDPKVVRQLSYSAALQTVPEIANSQHIMAESAAASTTNMDAILKELLAIRSSISSLEHTVSTNTMEVQGLRNEVVKFQINMQSTDARLSAVENLIDKIPDNSQDIGYLQQKVIELEDRSRRNNLRIIGLPEQIEKNNILDFLTTFLPTLTKITFSQPLDFQRAHRVRSRGITSSTRPRHVLACCLHHQQARQIILAAKKHGPYEYDSSRIIITADFSAPTNFKRKQFLNVRTRLKKREIKYGLLEPATMIVTFQGKTKEYFDPHDLESFLNDLDDKDTEMEHKSTSNTDIIEPTPSISAEDTDQGEWIPVQRQWTHGGKFKAWKKNRPRDKSRSPIKP
ncbi:hypothetical protein NDU88_000159 [Pleurodeles waltl]|uniref:L1 transposable element RRM domain-containing protein n=1 Tax=Pleurodeles waltl TaxID=8319 RepID=A0AAV7P485_PLEWA|nr:hypothetical protein NDU88_000159 [Pleurodeles waltl]